MNDETKQVPALPGIAKVRFCHDLEDGWYAAQLPDGSVIERNRWIDLRKELEGYALLWVGSAYYRPGDFPQPPDHDERLESAIDEVRAELQRAIRKFPTWPTDVLHAVAVVGEESGELTKAVLQAVYEPHKSKPIDVRTEAIQTAAMALRFLVSMDRYAFRRGEQHQQTPGMQA